MSRQTLHDSVVLLGATAVANGAPAGAAGIEMRQSFPASTPLSIDWLLCIQITVNQAVALEADFHLWGRPEETGLWGTLGNSDGQLNGAATITGTTTYVGYFVLQNLGVFERLYLEVRNIVGAGFSCNARLFPIYNCESSGLIS